MPGLNLTPEQQNEWDQLEAADQGKTIAVSNDTPEAKPVSTESAETKTPEVKAEGETKDAPSGDAAAKDAPTETKPDPLATLAPEMKDFMLGIKTAIDSFGQRFSKIDGHIGALYSQGNQLKTTLEEARKQVKSEGGDAPTKAQIDRAIKSPEKFEQLKQSYPEFAEAIEGYVGSALDTIKVPQGESKSVDPEAIKGSLMESVKAEVGGMFSRFAAEMQIELSHRGWKKTTASPEFVGWVQQQPREVQTLYVSDQPEDVIRILDLYQEGRKNLTNNTRRLDSAAALNATPAATVPSGAKSFDEMTPQEQWDFLERQDAQAAQAGRRQ